MNEQTTTTAQSGPSDRMQTQSDEFYSFDSLAAQWILLKHTAVVDDDYPGVRHVFESRLTDFIDKMKANGRFDHGGRYGLSEFTTPSKPPAGARDAVADEMVGRKVEVVRGANKGWVGVIRSQEIVCGYTTYTVDFDGVVIPEIPGTALWLHPPLKATQPAATGAGEGESLESQVDRLANFIIQNIPGEPSQSQGAIDTAIRLLNPVAAMSDALSGQEAMLAWAVNQWHDQVANRPLVNVHRRSLDDVWRQVIRHCGADDVVLIGPRHDQLLAESQESKS